MASNQSLPIVHKRISVRSSEKRVVEILQRYLKKGIVKLNSSHERGNYTDYYVSGTKDDIQNLQRSIEDSVAHRRLASTVAGIEDVQVTLIINLHGSFSETKDTLNSKAEDVISAIKKNSDYNGHKIDYKVNFFPQEVQSFEESPDSSEAKPIPYNLIQVQVKPINFGDNFESASISDDILQILQNCWPTNYTFEKMV